MARAIDTQIERILNKYKKMNMFHKIFKRFLDDLFLVICGNSKTLHLIFDEINNIHPNIKFTINHTSIEESDPCECPRMNSIPYLDTMLSIKSGKIISDLYKKSTDRIQYLLPSSCHPSFVTKSVTFSLAIRIVRICTETHTRDRRLEELKQCLLTRNYDLQLINTGIERARSIPRDTALKKVIRKKNKDCPTFVINFDPRLPKVNEIVQNHWRSSKVLDPFFAKVFPKPPIIACKNQKTLENYL